MTPLRSITGTLEELEVALAEEIRCAQADDPLAPIGVLIGGTLQRPYLQRRLADINGGIVNVRMLTESDLGLIMGEGQRVLAEELPLPPLADRVLLREIAVEHEGYFEEVRETPGFSSALFQLFRELRRAGHDAESLPEALAGSCETREKAQALTELFQEFMARRSGFYGADDCLADPGPLDPPFAQLFTYGVTDPPQALRDLLLGVAASCPVTVLRPAVSGAASSGLAELDAWLAEERVERLTLEPPASSTPASDLASTRRRLFDRGSIEAAGPQTPASDGSLTIASAPDPHREVREAVRQAIAWADSGLGFHEIAIAYREAEVYRPIVEAVLNEARIPAYLHEGTPISERPLGRRVIALLDLLEGDLGRREVMDFLADARLPDATRERYEVSAARWDQISKEAGVVNGLEDWTSRLAAHAAALREDDREWKRERADSVERLRDFVSQLALGLSNHDAVGGWRAHLDSLRRLLITYVEDHEQILEPLDGLDRFDALDEETTWERFIEVVRSAIETLRSDDVLGQRPGAFGIRGVNVLDTNSLQFLRFEAVAVLGLAERAFPPPPRQTPMLLDHERARVSEAGGKRVPLRAFGSDREPLQFRLVTEAARHRLLLSYPRKGQQGGQPRLPSYFLRAIAEAATGTRIDAERLPEQLADSGIYSHAVGSRIGAASAEDAISPAERDRSIIEADPALGEMALASVEPRIAWAREARLARLESRLTPYDGVLSETGREQLANVIRGSFSPSSLEGFATCPHKYLLNNVLGVGRTEEPEALIRISPLDRGTLLHRVLERFMCEQPGDGETKVHGASEETRLLAIAEEEFDLCVERGETGYPLLWHYDAEELRGDLRRWLASERADPRATEFSEGAYEVRFGYRGSGDGDPKLSTEEPLKIIAGGAELRIAGKIDRLDWAEGKGFRVVDYKGGTPPSEFKDGARLLGGRALQLPLYSLVAAELLGMEPSDGSAEYQYATRRGSYERRRFTGEAMADRREKVDQLLGGIANAVNAGEFQRSPKESRMCDWCDFNPVCPTARWQQIERKSDDDVAVRLAELREIE